MEVLGIAVVVLQSVLLAFLLLRSQRVVVPFTHGDAGVHRVDGGFSHTPPQVVAVWADTPGGWVDCRLRGECWVPLTGSVDDVLRLRFWLGPAGEILSVQGSGMLVPQTTQTAVPSDSANAGNEEVAAAAFTEVWREVAATGWSPRMPDGEGLLRLRDGHDMAPFGCAIATHLESAIRADVVDRSGAEGRQVAAAQLMDGAARLVAALDGSVRFLAKAPKGVGPRQVGTWLVDEALAIQLGNAPVGGVVQPLLVLRPAVLQDDHVLLEGVVA